MAKTGVARSNAASAAANRAISRAAHPIAVRPAIQ
jgi:hypothetical protein